MYGAGLFARVCKWANSIPLATGGDVQIVQPQEAHQRHCEVLFQQEEEALPDKAP